MTSLLLAGLLPASPLAAVAGKWTPDQLSAMDPEELRRLGLELPAGELWAADGSGGLLQAVVQLPGCTAAFVSAQGLLLTNHHCAFSILQQHSTPERDLIRNGFLAATLADELPAAESRVALPHRFTDVTARVEAAVPAGADDLERYRAIDRVLKELVAECEAQPFRRCRVAVDDDGVRYRLIETLEFPDVRLVYAPPLGVGEFGGEVDNWSWPRHTGDFALLRVYAAGGREPAPFAADHQPYQPARFLPVATRGLAAGDFVLVAGYPAQSYRSWLHAEVAARTDLFLPGRSALYASWLDVMHAAGEVDEVARIALADRVKRLANREKNARAQLDGIRRSGLLAAQAQAEAEVLAWAAARPEHAPAVAAYRDLQHRVASRRATWQRDFLLAEAKNGSLPLALALELARWSLERERPDLEREPDYQERNRERLLEGQQREQKRLHLATEQLLLADLLARLAQLPADQRVPAVDALLGGEVDADAIARRVEALFAGSRVLVAEQRLAMFNETSTQLRARGDALLDLAFALIAEQLPLEERDKRHQGAVSRLRPAWRRAVMAHAGRPVAPDANGSLRVSLAHVRGYHPRDGVFLEPFTRLAGLVAKHTGEEPFNVPAEVLAAAPQAPHSRWADPTLGDVPTCFLADGDTTGGSSGSPMLNGRGEVVGVNFDRVWENVANDYGYDPAMARQISADVRFLLWMLELAGGPGAGRLLAELGVGVTG